MTEPVSCRSFLYSSRRRIPVNQNGFSRANWRARRHRSQTRSEPRRITRRHKSLSSARQRRHPPLPEPSGTKITKWVISTPSSSRARRRSSKASRARSALISSRSRGPPAARVTLFARSVSPPRAPGRKQKIRDKDNTPVAQQRLIFLTKQLADDGKRLYEYGVFDGATMYQVLRPARVGN